MEVFNINSKNINSYSIQINPKNDSIFYFVILSYENIKSARTASCTTQSYIVANMCSEGLHWPWEGGCQASGKAYFSIYTSINCDQEMIDPNWGGGGFGDLGGGGGSSTDVDTDPCLKIKSNLTDANYKLKYDELNKTSNFTEKQEKGFYETKDGWFIGLEQAGSTSTSDGLKVPIADDVKGYTHIHLNDYEDGTFDEEGRPRIRQPIRMFSPADVNTLMELANIQTNGSYGD